MNYYDEIKKELLNNEVYKKAKDYSKNRSDLMTYYNVGRLIVEAQGGEARAKYGDRLIIEYSKKLTEELGKGYSVQNLKKMRKFYLLQKSSTLSSQISWSHYTELLKLRNEEEIYYYIKISSMYNLSVRELRDKIKSKEYERLDEETRKKLKENNRDIEYKVRDFIKHPVVLKNKYNAEEISEKYLKHLILEDMDQFLLQLGPGFTYVGNEYKIKIGDRYNYIDLLLFNYIYNCFVVVEFKVTEFKAEHIGQIKKYMSYIDKNLKTVNQDRTIGIVICKKDNEFLIQYCSDDRVYRTTFEISEETLRYVVLNCN